MAQVRRWLRPTAREQALTDNTLAALALDANGQLWAGSFRHGLDVLAGNRRVAHRETTEIAELNALVPDGDSMWAATSQGAFRFDAGFHPSPLLTNDTRAATPAVLHLARDGDGLVLATSRGLSRVANGRLERLSTVQGLPSNSLYAVQLHKNALYAATLGGLAQIVNGQVVRVFKDSNSDLTNNWVSALCVSGERLFAGTYGGGVYELDAAGQLRPLPQTARLTVNPNALRADAERLYAGTLTGAWVFDFRAQSWTQLRDEMPAPTVLSVATDERAVYFGTTNGIARIEKTFFTP